MADTNITQAEADKLMAMQKKAVDRTEWIFPGPAERILVPLTSLDKRENFLLDVTRYQIKLTKATFQNRAHVTIILYRLDIDGAPHRNPDGLEIACPHLHIYRQDFRDKWAIPAQWTDFPILQTCFQRLTPSWNTATSPSHHKLKKAYSHDDRSRDRAPFTRLSRMAERQDHIARGQWGVG